MLTGLLDKLPYGGNYSSQEEEVDGNYEKDEKGVIVASNACAQPYTVVIKF